MVRKFFFENEKNIRKALPKIKEKIKLNLFLKGKIIFIKGKEYDEFLVEKILSAIDFGFDVEDALTILEDSDFVVINIKDYTRRNNLEDIRGRLIGKKGKVLKLIENLSNSKLLLRKNKIGIICDSENMEETEKAIKYLIRGSKHGKVFSFLEKNKADSKNFDFGFKTK
ncbi:MAG: hypothetical protein QW103_02030 [Candidatus Pacearchaeota archaeon]